MAWIAWTILGVDAAVICGVAVQIRRRLRVERAWIAGEAARIQREQQAVGRWARLVREQLAQTKEQKD